MFDLSVFIPSGVVAAIVTLAATTRIARANRGVGALLLLVSAGTVWWFFAADLQVPGRASDPQALARTMAAALLCVAVLGYSVGLVGGPATKAEDTPSRPGKRQGPARTLRESCDGMRLVRIVGDEYVNEQTGLSLRGIGSWLVQEMTPDFQASGGFLAVDSPDHSATFNLSAGAIDAAHWPKDMTGAPALEQWAARARSTFEELRASVHGAPIRQLERFSLDGESCTVRFEFRTANGRMGKVCAIHDGREFVSYYAASDAGFGTIDALFSSWRWVARWGAE